MIKYTRWNIPEYGHFREAEEVLALSKAENRKQLLNRFRRGQVAINNVTPLALPPSWAAERRYTNMPDVFFYQANIGEAGFSALIMGRGMRIVLAALVDGQHSELLYAVEEKGVEVVFDSLAEHTAPRGWE